MDIEAVAAQLGTTFSPDEPAIAETMLRNPHGTIHPASVASTLVSQEIIYF